MQSTRTKKYTFFIGIDVSRNKLDYAVMKGKTLLFHKESLNQPADINIFVSDLKILVGFTITKAIFCLEQTGIYSNHLLACLRRHKCNVVIETPLQIRGSLGTLRGKYDKIDAIRIATYAYKCRDELRLITYKRPIIVQLAELISLRNRLIGLQTALKLPLSEQSEFSKKSIVNLSKSLCRQSALALKDDIDKVNKHIEAVIDSDMHIKRLMEVVQSVKCIGPVTALQLLVSTNEFKGISDPKKFACYSGVAPFKRESGTVRTKARVSNIANKKVKALLHICAVGAIRHDKELKAYYYRKTVDEGKPPMAVINAIRYKIILRVFACVAQNRLYENHYQRPGKVERQELPVTA